MPDHLSQLKWFTTEQALRYLKQEKSIDLTQHDLFSHCEQGNCIAVMNPGRLAGKSTSWIEGEENSYFQTVYSAGESRILNPLTILDSVATSPVTVYLCGQVWEKYESDATSYPCDEWTVELKPQDCKVRFHRSEIDSFAASIKVATATASPTASLTEEIPSHSLVIAALLELLLEPGRRNYNQSGITKEIVSRHGKWYGIGDSSLPKLFAACNKAAKEADKIL
ncbi:hypothetical protein ALQ61_04358 [Pseudomonas coronafaciens pv. zizaniae]|uniref:hypothetical protein n=1 Tax=Pseudomonas coronafaciens TaxID=53409 RepID=UPI000F00BE1F|nr:hypothetical protein [Pseudomonas coronafaciens]RMN31063.1 hypothetical protein ALQ61_04358 [Pseudomonas coronafaciens pv. zizaniae]